MTTAEIKTSTASDEAAKASTDRVVVVIPMPNDPDWSIFEELSEDIPIIVADDSDGRLAPPPRDNVTYYDYAAQREIMGVNYPALPHKSAASRNFGHYLAWRDGYDVIFALDYDCRPRPGWLESHLSTLTSVTDAPAVQGEWINSITAPGFYARGYPYEYRNAEASVVHDAVASGEVKLNMGLWDGILDLNGVDKLAAEPPAEPGLREGPNRVALGNIPVCGMNNAFRAELTPAYFFLPDLWIDGWQLSRHDDIWGGYVVKKLMDLRGDLFTFGSPVVEHTKQTRLERVVVLEQWMHLMADGFFACVDAAVSTVRVGEYATMFAEFTEAFLSEAGRSREPAHYRAVYRQLGESMQRWAACFV
jgi:hypothetical protein